MAGVSYYSLGPDRRLSEIVFAGSHDASIVGGGQNAQTQSLDILGQANAGVRIFDLRILARTRGNSGNAAQLVGYHGSPKQSTKTKFMLATDQQRQIKVATKMNTGTFGMALTSMLRQARKFVAETNEFLIFKFDKCTNYQLIAEYCVDYLGPAIYTNGGSIGRKTLNDLKNRVVCVFPTKGLQEIQGLGPGDGINGWRNLNGKEGPRFRQKSVVKPYDANFDGLQYFGKGGTDPLKIWKGNDAKMKENEAKQGKLIRRMGANIQEYSADVLGMMYWTTTGLLESIQTRNDKMWNLTGVNRMSELWKSGLEESVGTQLRQEQMKYIEFGGVRRMKAHFPNIVMIDFADEDKCGTIFQLNEVKDQVLAKAYDAFMAGQTELGKLY
jgi:hypothetical protein